MLASGASLTAVLITPISIWLHMFFCIAITAWGARQIRTNRHDRRISHIESEALWRIETAGQAPFEGKLVKMGYRSAALIILTIQQDDSTLRRIAVWQDQLPKSAYSYLHLQLAFNTQPPVRRQLSAVISHLTGPPLSIRSQMRAQQQPVRQEAKS